MLLLECDQGTPEWHAARVGVCTASRFKDACDRLAGRKRADGIVVPGLPTKACLKYADDVALERVTGEAVDQGYQTWQMRAGQEREPVGRAIYERRSGQWVEQAGLALTDDRVFGYSTDGLVGNDGAIEIKSPSSATVILTMWRDGDLSEYMHQIQGGLWLTGRKWIDFVMYVPALAAVGKDLYVKRVERDEEFIEDMESKLLEFKAIVEVNEKALRAQEKADVVTE